MYEVLSSAYRSSDLFPIRSVKLEYTNMAAIEFAVGIMVVSPYCEYPPVERQCNICRLIPPPNAVYRWIEFLVRVGRGIEIKDSSLSRVFNERTVVERSTNHEPTSIGTQGYGPAKEITCALGINLVEKATYKHSCQ